MREILYRGKRKDNDKWVYGYYCRCGWTGMEKDVIIPSYASALYGIDVIPEKVGQYTGLTDKNGTKIFEGDIVKCTDTNNSYDFRAVVLFGNPNGEYNWGFQLKRIGGAIANTDILLWAEMEETGAFIDVVGNIHSSHEKRIYEKCIYEDFNKKAEV